MTEIWKQMHASREPEITLSLYHMKLVFRVLNKLTNNGERLNHVDLCSIINNKTASAPLLIAPSLYRNFSNPFPAWGSCVTSYSTPLGRMDFRLKMILRLYPFLCTLPCSLGIICPVISSLVILQWFSKCLSQELWSLGSAYPCGDLDNTLPPFSCGTQKCKISVLKFLHMKIIWIIPAMLLMFLKQDM